jgi:hypothetical protein
MARRTANGTLPAKDNPVTNPAGFEQTADFTASFSIDPSL